MPSLAAAASLFFVRRPDRLQVGQRAASSEQLSMKKLLLALTAAATLAPSLTSTASAGYCYRYHWRVWRCGNHVYWNYQYRWWYN